jgi:hypothetical protein
MASTPSYAKLAAEAQDQTLKAIEQAQDASMKLVSAAWEQSQHLPTPAQAIESAFDFAGRVLELQKQYALRLAGAAPSAKAAAQS